MLKKYLLLIIILLCSYNLPAQTKLKSVQGGHQYSIDLPDYMVRTFDLNEVASLQYMSAIKQAYVVIIEDEKEHLKYLGMAFSDPKAFWENFYTDFKTAIKITKEPTVKDIPALNGQKIVSAEFEASVGEENTNIIYYIAVVETSGFFYKVMCWTTSENPDKNKVLEDFKKSIVTLKD